MAIDLYGYQSFRDIDPRRVEIIAKLYKAIRFFGTNTPKMISIFEHMTKDSSHSSKLPSNKNKVWPEKCRTWKDYDMRS